MKRFLVDLCRLAFLFSVVLVPSAFGFELKDQGKPVLKAESAELRARSGGAKSLAVDDINEKAEIVFETIPFNQLMRAVYGERWQKAEEVLFTCADGYQPSIAREVFERFDAYLAFARKGDESFSLVNRLHQGKKVPLGPFYLVWDTKKTPAILKESPDYWPYQVVSVDLVRFNERFPRLAPPAGASKAVLRGFTEYRARCLTCHAINGQGGKVGPELNYPTSVTEMFHPEMLRRWLSNPQSMRWKTIMPGVPKDTPGRERVIEDLLAYLKAMRSRKLEPEAK